MSDSKVAARVTPLTYLTEVLATSWRHGGELAVAVSCVAIVGITM